MRNGRDDPRSEPSPGQFAADQSVSAAGGGAVAAPPSTETAPDTDRVTEEKVKEAFEKAWQVIVWNDPVNLMSYVVFIFMKVLAFNKETATRHMLEVHHRGKSCVARETREKAELFHQQLQSHGLTVTIEQD